MENIEEIKRTLENKAITPAYRQALEKRLKEVSAPGQPTEAPKPALPAKAKYAGVSNMAVEEIVSFYSTGQFYRLDTPITGLEALCSVYRIFGICGKERETVARVGEAIERMGGEVPEMPSVKIDDLLKRQ